MSSKSKKKPAKSGKKKKDVKERANKVMQPASGVLVQVSKYFANASISQQAALIAASIMCPGAYPPVRFQDGYDCMETLPVSPFMVQDISFSTTTGGLDILGMPNNEQWAFAFRDPRRCLVYLDHNSGGGTWEYDMCGVWGAPTWTMPSVAPPSTDMGVQYMISGSVYKPHGEIVYPGTVDSFPGLSFFPIQYGDAITISGMTASVVRKLNIVLYDGGDNIQTGFIQATTTGAGVGTFVLSAANLNGIGIVSGWFGHIGLRSVTDSAGTTGSGITSGQVTMSGVSAVWCHLSLSDYEDIEELIESFRANGLSLMFTNTAQELNRNGDVAGWQVPKSMPWQYLARQGFSALAQKPRRGLGEAKNGLHGWWKPTNATDMNFRGVGQEVSTYLSESAYSLEPESDYLAICVNIPLETGRAGRWVVSVNGEARFESSWFAHVQDMPYSRAACQQAMELLVAADQWHENPSHLKDIVKYLQDHRGDLQEVLKSVGTNFPMLAPFANILSSATNLLK